MTGPWHVIASEWRTGYCSARRDGWSRRWSLRFFIRETAKGLRDLPNRWAEERRAG
jgi:hypothetical protein